MTLQVIKKDGTKETFNSLKIIEAVSKAAERAGVTIPLESSLFNTLQDISDSVCEHFSGESKWLYSEGIPTKELHSVVIRTVRDLGYPEVADTYQEYRDYKNTYAKSFENVKNEADTVLLLGDNENANFDSSLISTKGSLIKGYLTKELYKQFYLSKREKELTKQGDIYIHDLRDMIFNSFNCCLFDMGTVLKNGFSMSNVTYTEPTSVLSALQVIGDVTLVATAQQFGGFTLAELDKVLLPYCQKTFDKAYAQFLTYSDDVDTAKEFAFNTLIRELEQGFQSLELKLNTVPCSRGDFAFTTITFGEWNPKNYSTTEQCFLAMTCETILKVRMEGHGGKQVVFPKLVYLYSEEQHENDELHQEVFDLAIQCSSKCMYPDYLSLDKGVVADIYKRTGTITSPIN